MTRVSARVCGALLVLALACLPAAAEPAEDRLGVPGPIGFAGVDYALGWSAQPSAGYFKQEYVPAGQTPERFETMLLLEVLTGGADVNSAVTSQVDMLEKRKANDSLVNYDVIQNKATGEVLLDFLMSSQESDGVYIVEWNAYRYAPYAGPDGAAGVYLFAVSERAYGNQKAKEFLNTLKDLRAKRIGELIAFAVPAVTPAP